MAFLDNSGDIILDAVLTDLGRKRLAAGNFRISKFALGDEEINYRLFDGDHPSGSAFSDLEILQTPILEAFTSDQSLMNTRLTSFSRTNFLYLPILKINDSAITSCKPDSTISGFNVVADLETLTNNNTANGTTNSGFINGMMGAGSGETTTHICVDQGYDSNKDGFSIAEELDIEFLESAYLIRLDHRLLRLEGFLQTDTYTKIESQFVDDDMISTYYVKTTPATIDQRSQLETRPIVLGPRFEGNDRLRNEISPTATNLSTIDNYEMFKGPLGNVLRITPRVSTSVQQSNSLFKELGADGVGDLSIKSDLTYTNGQWQYINTVMNVVGATTGYSIDIPIRIVKKK